MRLQPQTFSDAPGAKARPDLLPFPRLLLFGIVLCTLAGFAGAGWWALHVGKGISWDQMNYHYYNVYAWLQGRMDDHLAPAGMQSWINPLAYVPAYLMVNHLPPRMTGFLFGALAGLNFGLLFALGCLMLRREVINSSPLLAAFIALGAGLVGLSDPFFHSNLGTSDADVYLSLLVIASLCLLGWAAELGSEDVNPYSHARDWAFAAAAALLGMAAGLKLTYFVQAAAMTATLLLLWRPLGLNPRRFLHFAAGGAAGYALTGIYWNLLLWSRYGNPFLPYWNNLFHSRWLVDSNFRDTRFPAGSLRGLLSFPFAWLRGEHPTSEGPFRIAVFALLEILIPLVAAVALARLLERRRQKAGAKPEPRQDAASLTAPRAALFLLVFCVLSYGLWAWMFAIQRYLEATALLAGWLLWICCDYLIPQRAGKVALFAALGLFSVVWMQGEKQDWRVPYGQSWFGVNLPAELQQDHTLFIALGGSPTSYLTPFLPSGDTVVRLNELTIPMDGSATILVQRAALMIARHRGPMRSLSAEPLDEHARYYLARYGLSLVEAACVGFTSDASQFTSCPIARMVAAPNFPHPSPLPR
jgi:hypothetical protein